MQVDRGIEERVSELYRRALSGEWLSVEEGALVWDYGRLDEVMGVAHRIRVGQHGGERVTWQIDRNINITNVCSCGCLFCNFHSGSGYGGRGYVTTREEYVEKIEELLELGGDQVLLQGGLHPGLGLDFYLELFGWLRSEYPGLAIHALGPPEVHYLSEQSGLSVERVLELLVEHGLSSLPGAGAEILVDRVRGAVSPGKCSSGEWLAVMRAAHGLGLLTSATMMYGHAESVRDRLEHMVKLRELQGERPAGSVGFMAFIAWPVQGSGTRLAREYELRPVRGAEHLRLTALARMMMPNIPHIQASWLGVGVPVAQLSLWGGADDMGSILIEERVMASAGNRRRLDAAGMQRAIRESGFRPQLRDQGYHYREVPAGVLVD